MVQDSSSPTERSNPVILSEAAARSSPVILNAAKDLAAARDSPFAEFPLSEAHGLSGTRGDGSNGQVQFVQIEPCLNDQSRCCHAERSEAALCPLRYALHAAQCDRPSPILL